MISRGGGVLPSAKCFLVALCARLKVEQTLVLSVASRKDDDFERVWFAFHFLAAAKLKGESNLGPSRKPDIVLERSDVSLLC